MPPKKRNSGTQKELKPGAEGGSPDKKESPELHKDKDAEFVTLCKNLHVTDLVCDRAWTLWKTVQESMDEVTVCTLEIGQKKLWGACLFVTMTDLDVPCFTLTQVLKAVNMNVKQFLSLVRKLDVNLDTISTKVNSALTRVEKKYDVMLALYQRFEKDREIVRSCWTMFLLAKGNALQMEDDLVISFQLLLCAVEFFIKRCPPDLLQPLYSKPQSHHLRQHITVNTIFWVKNVYQTSFLAFLDSLDLSRSTDLPQVNSLNQQYNEHYLKSRDIDDRLFLDGDETILPPKIEITQVERTPKKNLQEEDSVIIPPQTPIKAAMASIQQLRGDLVSSGDQPSTTLATYFKNCTIDPTQGMLKRLEMLGQTFSQRFSQAVGPRFIIIGKQRFTLGVRLYYKVMEEMLKSEEKRLSVQNFSKLLNDSTFHTSLLACALEVVMFVTNCNHCVGETAETDLCFPWILDVFSLAAFDFYKVIESFIKAEPTLSKDIVKHLETCENLIMEKIAWRTGSVLFELLKQEHEGGAAEQAEAPASFNQPLQHNHTAADLYLSPMHPGLRVLPPESPAPPNSQHASQPQNQPALQPGGQTPRHLKSNSLSLFYKKLYRLAYTRLKLLCSYLLSFNPELEPIIWTLFQHTLQHEYELMKNRHLDQLMMSAMYAICKVKSVDLRFKTIVTAYKNMPNTNQETFKHVLISDGHYDSIIVFYNQVFMQRLKTNILQYASPRPPTLSPIPQIPRSPYKFPNSPLRVPGSNNVYISPLKSPRMSPGIMTPRSRYCILIPFCCFLLQLSNRFQKINQMVNSSDRSFKRTLDLGPTPKPLKRLRFDVDGQDEADGRLVAQDVHVIFLLWSRIMTRNNQLLSELKQHRANIYLNLV
uniref:Retinoblastoma 1 n=1 Tax=Sphaeramia orbicularis TaxID=375764 RepID=A0A673BWL1_9TELE